MRIIRVALVTGGVAMGLWGVWLMRDFDGDQVRSAGLWFATGILVHDGVLAPLVVLYAALHMRVIPAYARKPATIGLILWGTLTVAIGNVLSGKGGKADNHSLLDRPYVTTWLILTAVSVLVVCADILWRRLRIGRPETIAKGLSRS